MRTYKAFDNTGNEMTVKANNNHDAIEQACEKMIHAPVRVEHVKKTKQKESEK